LRWLPDQSGLLITARRQPDKNFRIWQVGRTSGQAIALTSDSESYSELSLSGDGSVLISSQVEPGFHLQVYPSNNNGLRPKELSSGSTVSYAPDGRIVFSSMKTGNEEIWITDADGSDEHQLTNHPSEDVTPTVSRDGGTVFFASNRSGEIEVWKMDPDGSNQAQVTRREGGFPLTAVADGHWVYYKSAIRKTILRVSLEDGREEEVFDRRSNNSAVSPDAKFIAFTEKQNDENILKLVSLADRSLVRTYRLADPKANLLCFAWPNDENFIAYILIDRSDRASIWFQPIDGTEPRKGADLIDEEVFESSGLALSPGGDALAVIQGNWDHNMVLIKGLKNALR
jgi:TolB protein